MKNAAGRWIQTAVICAHFMVNDVVTYHEPHIDLRILRSRFTLFIKHRVGDEMIETILSRAPWTSGIYKNIPNTSRDNPISRLPLSEPSNTPVTRSLSHREVPPPYVAHAVVPSVRADTMDHDMY
jgi:hypothetical protein